MNTSDKLRILTTEMLSLIDQLKQDQRNEQKKIYDLQEQIVNQNLKQKEAEE